MRRSHDSSETSRMDYYVEFLLEKWQSATLIDYAHAVLAIVILGWFVSKTCD